MAPDSSSGYEWAMMKESNRGWERSGEFVEDIICDVAGVEEDVVLDAREFLSDEHGFVAVKDGEVDPYASNQMYTPLKPDDLNFSDSVLQNARLLVCVLSEPGCDICLISRAAGVHCRAAFICESPNKSSSFSLNPISDFSRAPCGRADPPKSSFPLSSVSPSTGPSVPRMLSVTS